MSLEAKLKIIYEKALTDEVFLNGLISDTMNTLEENGYDDPAENQKIKQVIDSRFTIPVADLLRILLEVRQGTGRIIGIPPLPPPWLVIMGKDELS